MHRLAIPIDDGHGIAHPDGRRVTFLVDEYVFRPRLSAILATLHDLINISAIAPASFPALGKQQDSPFGCDHHDRDAVSVIAVLLADESVHTEIHARFLRMSEGG